MDEEEIEQLEGMIAAISDFCLDCEKRRSPVCNSLCCKLYWYSNLS